MPTQSSTRSVRSPAGGVTLESLPRQAPVTVDRNSDIRRALEAMDRHRVGSVVVVDADGRPVGILTLQDVLRRVALPGVEPAAPITTVMTTHVESLPATASLHEALLFMNHRQVRHAPMVAADGSLVGVVSLNQLRDPFGGAVDGVMRRIDAADTLDELADLAAGARRLGATLFARHPDAGLLTAVLTALNDVVTRRAIELVLAERGQPPAPWCWVVMGSGGRFEQTFSTDQDNGMIFSAVSTAEAVALRAWFQPLGQAVNQALDRCGIPLCAGGIMAGNGDCCLSLEEWTERFYGWVRTPDQTALLNATIYFDYRPLFGDLSLAQALRRELLALTQDHDAFQRFLAVNALDVAPPVGVLRDFVTTTAAGKRPGIDLKKFGARLFVDVARILALADGCAETSTVARLRSAGPAWGIQRAEIDSAVQAFAELQRIRMAWQQQSDAVDEDGANFLDPDRLTRLDRKILHEALRQAQSLQLRLKQTYAL